MTARRWRAWTLAACGVGLAGGLLAVARPGNVARLARHADWRGLLVALALVAALAVLRGARLCVVSGGRLGVAPGVAVAAAAQLAVGVLPLRLGEVALVPLLAAAGVPGTVRGLSLAIAARALDVGSVLVCAVVAAFLIGGSPAVAAAALLAVIGAAFAALGSGTAALRLAARRWRERPGARRRLLRQLLEVRRELRRLWREPIRAIACVGLSLLIWAAIWMLSVALLRAMRLDWPAGAVLLGVLGGSVASSLPVNAAGNFGTQEAGWAAALAGVGVDPASALAAGFAAHLWTLAFQAVLGGAAIAYLWARQSASDDSTPRAMATSGRSSRRGA